MGRVRRSSQSSPSPGRGHVVVRRYAEPVEVQLRMPQVPDSPQDLELPGPSGLSSGLTGVVPQAFLWRGRRYRVQAVTAHWRERRAWWREALDPPPGVPHGIAAAARERLVWRVEAVAGHSRSVGVFDLACVEPDPAVLAAAGSWAAAGPPGGWRLLRVAD